MKKKYFYSSLFVTCFVFYFSSCVSKKKYISLLTKVDSLTQVINNQNNIVEKLRTDSVTIHSTVKNQVVVQPTYVAPTKKRRRSILSTDVEYSKKSQFVLNFILNIEWPSRSHKTFSIFVLNNKSLASKMQVEMNGKKVNGLPIEVIPVSSLNKIIEADLVYLPQKQSGSLEYLKQWRNDVLLITELDELDEVRCNCINLTIDKDKIGYTMNAKYLHKNGFKISQLLFQLEEK